MNTKDILKKYISEELFEDLSYFVEELYFMQADYLILMARKFFNLFFLFHELNCEKYKALGIPYKNERIKIVSDRALPVLENLLRNPTSEVKQIVIGDDIIIHGRGIRVLFDRLHEINPNIDVVIESFIINNDDTTAYDDIKDKINSCYEVSHDKWREVSDKIVASFLLSGRPYISYLPYFLLDIEWDALFQKIGKENVISISEPDMEYYGVECSVYFGEEFNIIRDLNCCEIAAMRFYHYKQVERVIAIPYFVTKTINRESVQGITNEFRKEFFTEKYRDKVKEDNRATQSMCSMELEYTMSLLLARILFDRAGLVVKDWPREIEIGTFSERLLNVDSIERLDIERLIQIVKNNDVKIKPREVIQPPNEDELQSEYIKIKEYYSDCIENIIDKVNWLKVNMTIDECISEAIGKLLFANGNLDEIRCKNNKNDDKSRLMGVPVSYVISDGVNFWSKYSGNNKENRKKRIFAEIIQAVDSGRGSIVIRTLLDKKGVEVNQSLLHAGEQNYKYCEVRNYPFMYGLMLIEHISRNKNYNMSETETKNRYREYQTMLNCYYDLNGIYYRLDEQKDLMEISIIDEYGRLLLSEYERYKNYEVFAKARQYANDVIWEVING